MGTSHTRRAVPAVLVALCFSILIAPLATAAPKVIVISLDGATPRTVNKFLRTGVLPRDRGLGLLRRRGIFAGQNITVTPSITAPGHIAIATGSTAAHNDINSNTFHLVTGPFNNNISGFSAPIGGHSIDGPGPSSNPTAEPIWLTLRNAGKKVVTATFPGGDGSTITVPGLKDSPVIQAASVRTADYTVPFGEFGGLGGRGFSLTNSDFGPAPTSTTEQLLTAGKRSFSPVLQKTTPLETFHVGGVNYTIQVAAFDTTDNATADYDTLVFFDSTHGVQPGPFSLPSTGPAYVKASEGKSSLFYLEGSPKKGGTAFFVSVLAPDLSRVHIARYSVGDTPSNAAVQNAVDDINAHVGPCGTQADHRFPQRINPGLADFTDMELEAIYEDQVSQFVDYQARVALRAIEQNPDADLVMVYIEQPDGSEHQFFLTDPRQPTNPQDPASIGAGQDPAKIARYARHIEHAYQAANEAVQKIIEATGLDNGGRLKSNIIVTSDHGLEAFHTAVSMNNLLASSRIPSTKVRAVTSGPVVNLYINLIGRGPNGTVAPAEYPELQHRIVMLLQGLRDTNKHYTLGHASVPVFDRIFVRPVPKDLDDPNFGRGTSEFIGQDAGDVFAMLTPGYNFDGTPSPVQRLEDPVSAEPILSLPGFYGAHGYDPQLEHMSAIFFAAGPDIRKGKVKTMHNIDIAPTVAQILQVKPGPTVDGKVRNDILRTKRKQRAYAQRQVSPLPRSR